MLAQAHRSFYIFTKNEKYKRGGGVSLLCSILFGLGIGLLFMGLFLKDRTNRFKRELRETQKNQLLNLLRPLAYLKPIQYLLKGKKSFSRIETEHLLERAGRPSGVKAQHIILAKILLPLVIVFIVLVYYGLNHTAGVLKLTFIDGVAISKTPSLGKPLLVLLAGVIAGFNAPGLILKQYIRKRERLVMSEQGLFSEIIFMSLQARINLKDAIEEAGKTTEYLRPYLQICLNEWHNDRIRALNNLKKNVGVLSFSIVIDLLTQAAIVGDEKIARFLEENKKLEDEIKNLEITAKNKTRPLIMTAQMVLPLLVILIILFYPLSLQVEHLIRTFF